MTEPTSIDLHYHAMPPAWLADPDVRRRLPPQVRPIADAWTPAGALSEMDRAGVGTVVSSVSNPGVWFGDAARARTLARRVNEYAAELGREHPGRFLGLAALPLPDVDGALAEIAYALDTLGLAGVATFTSVDGRWLADPSAWPVWAELDRRRAVLFVHPTTEAEWPSVPGVPAPFWDYHAETGRALLQWVLTEAQDRFPHVRLVFSHGAGPVLTALGRLELMARTRSDLGLPTDLAARVRRLYVEVSASTDAAVLGVLAHHLDPGHVLLGTDSPFVGPMAPTVEQLAEQELDEAVRAAIEAGNARRLLGLAAEPERRVRTGVGSPS